MNNNNQVNFDINKLCSVKCDRVKGLDFHPSSPWILVSLYNGFVFVWDYELKELVMSFEVDDLPSTTPRYEDVPVRAAKFIPQKGWIVTGSSDGNLRIFDYHKKEKVISFKAHKDYIRDILVHPTLPLILSCADDMTIKSFNWEKDFGLVTNFVGHSHYVMHLSFHPNNTNLFASVSLDQSIREWDINCSHPITVIKQAHDKGIDWGTYFVKEGQLLFATSADDKKVKIFDMEKKKCIQTLNGHTRNVSTVCAFPEFNLIVSGAEDKKIMFWDLNTFALKKTLDYNFKRVWALAPFKDMIAVGCDEGLLVLKIDDDIFGNSPQNGTELLILKTEFQLPPPLSASPVVTFICSVCQRTSEYHKAPAIHTYPTMCSICYNTKIHYKERIRANLLPVFISILFLGWPVFLFWRFSNYHQWWRWLFLVGGILFGGIETSVLFISMSTLFYLIKTNRRINVLERQMIV